MAVSFSQFLLTAMVWLLLSPVALFAQDISSNSLKNPIGLEDWRPEVNLVDFSSNLVLEQLPMLDSILDRYQFFFMGEEHWKTINTEIQWSFLRYLHQQAGVRNLIVEGGYSFGFLLNQYLSSGDEGILKKALTNIPVCPEDQRSMYRRIYRYNQNLDPEDRIQVTGIDVEHSPELVLQVLYTLRPEAKEVPRAIRKEMKQLVELHESYYIVKSDVKRFFKRMGKSMARNEAVHREYWGTDFARVRMLAENTLAGYEFKYLKAMIFEDTWQERESQMYSNFIALQPYMAQGGYFAQFGVLHTDLHESSQWEFPTLAQRLNKIDGSPVEDQVLTISRYVRRMDERYEALGQGEPMRRLIKYLERRYPDQIVLCNMLGPDSPFPKLGKNFQYLILIDEDLEESACN